MFVACDDNGEEDETRVNRKVVDTPSQRLITLGTLKMSTNTLKQSQVLNVSKNLNL